MGKNIRRLTKQKLKLNDDEVILKRVVINGEIKYLNKNNEEVPQEKVLEYYEKRPLMYSWDFDLSKIEAKDIIFKELSPYDYKALDKNKIIKCESNSKEGKFFTAKINGKDETKKFICRDPYNDDEIDLIKNRNAFFCQFNKYICSFIKEQSDNYDKKDLDKFEKKYNIVKDQNCFINEEGKGKNTKELLEIFIKKYNTEEYEVFIALLADCLIEKKDFKDMISEVKENEYILIVKNKFNKSGIKECCKPIKKTLSKKDNLKSRLYTKDYVVSIENKYYENDNRDEAFELIINLSDDDLKNYINIVVCNIYNIDYWNECFSGKKASIPNLKEYYKSEILKNYEEYFEKNQEELSEIEQDKNKKIINYLLQEFHKFMKGRCRKEYKNFDKDHIIKKYMRIIKNRIVSKTINHYNINSFEKELNKANKTLSRKVKKYIININETIKSRYNTLDKNNEFKNVEDIYSLDNDETFIKIIKKYYSSYENILIDKEVKKGVSRESINDVKSETIISLIKNISKNRNILFHYGNDIGLVLIDKNINNNEGNTERGTFEENIDKQVKKLRKIYPKLLLKKFESNNTLKYYNVSNYFDELKDYNYGISDNRKYLPAFDKVFNYMIWLYNVELDEDIKKYFKMNKENLKKIFNNLYKDDENKEDEEKKLGFKYLIQNIYYEIYSNQEIKIDSKNGEIDIKIDIKEYFTNYQRKASIDNEAKEYYEKYKIAIARHFIDWLGKRNNLYIEKEGMEEISEPEIKFEYSEYNKDIIGIALFLSTKNLSNFRHDLSKYLQFIEEIIKKYNRFVDENDTSIEKINLLKNMCVELNNSIAIISLLQEYRDAEINIPYLEYIELTEKILNNIDNIDNDEIVSYKELNELKSDIMFSQYLTLSNQYIKNNKDVIEDIKDFCEMRIDKYDKFLVKIAGEGYKKIQINLDGYEDKVNLYYDNKNIINHSYIGKVLKYSDNIFMNDFIEKSKNIKITDFDIERYGKLYNKKEYINDEINNRLKEINKVNKLQRQKEYADGGYKKELTKNYKDKVEYEYIRNKIFLTEITLLSNMIDDVYSRLLDWITIWEDTICSYVYKKYNYDKDIKALVVLLNKDNNLKEHLQNNKLLENDNLILEKFKKDENSKIWEYLLRNAVCHYYLFSDNNFTSLKTEMSILDLLFYTYRLLEFDKKMQMSVLPVIEKILSRYGISREDENKPILKVDYDKNTVIFTENIGIRKFKYDKDIEIISEERLVNIKDILSFKRIL